MHQLNDKNAKYQSNESKPNINTIPKQRKLQRKELSRVNSVSSISKNSHYSHPVCPPRPVNVPHVMNSENSEQMCEPIQVTSKATPVAAINKMNQIASHRTPSSSSVISSHGMCDEEPPVRPPSPRIVSSQPINKVTNARSPILRPIRPRSPRLSSSSEDDSPPPRPASPVFHIPDVKKSSVTKIAPTKSTSDTGFESRHRGEMMMTRSGHPSSNGYDLDNLVDLVTERLRSNKSRQNVRLSSSMSVTPPQHQPPMVRPHSRSIMPQTFDFTDSRSTTPQQLSKQNSFNNFGVFSQGIRSQDNRSRHSSEYMDDSDYGAYPTHRDFMGTPSFVDERNLSRMGSTSYFDENDYSAFTPDLRTQRKMSFSSVSSVCNTPLLTPKVNRDFGFVSSKKEPAKPPRRRSKEPQSSGSRPVSRQLHSSSRESTPVNNPVKSPVRPSRLRGKKHPRDHQHQIRTNKSGAADKINRPMSLQEAEPVYEILTPVASTFHSSRRHNYCSSSDSESDFRTPQASPRLMRQAVKNTRRQSDVYEDVDIGTQSYQNVRDNPLINGSKKSSQRLNDDTTSCKQIRPKMIPPRKSQDPIPTPRKSSLSRSRDQSVESLHSMSLSLPRKLYPKKEPHYKVPRPNPRPVNPVNDCHLYSQIVYEDEGDKQSFNDMDLKKKSTISDKRSQQPDQIRQSKHMERSKLSDKKQSSGNSSRKSVDSISKCQNNYPEGRKPSDRSQSRSKQKSNICKNGDLENNSNELADSDVKVELTGEEDRFYDAKEELVKKSKAIATLPDGSKYPCVIVQKKAKSTENSLKRENKLKTDVSTPPQKAQRNFKNYTPVEMKMKPDWFDDLKVKDEPKGPRPTSIIDGVLYTSRALIEEEKSKSQKLNTFNLIQPEVFETYDVCKNYTREYDKIGKQRKVKQM